VNPVSRLRPIAAIAKAITLEKRSS